MIINIEPWNFGGQMRNGDLIALLNLLVHLRKQPPLYKDLQFHVPNRSIQLSDYVIQFRDWLQDNTPFLSKEPGTQMFNGRDINLWDHRAVTGDLLELNFLNRTIEKKICIFPVMDAPYNVYRNWSVEMVNSIIDHYMQPQYDGYTKILGMQKYDPYIKQQGFVCSTNFIQNIEHIATCSHYVGGDTGTSHFAAVLPMKEKLNYYYGSVGLLHTTPLYALQGKGNINLFWQNNWRTDLL